ncbi:MAG: SoxR reducing system RseC family protein [Candidatus Omnitrophota bacterium]
MMKEKGIVIKKDEKGVIVEIIHEEKCTRCCSCAVAEKRQIKVPAPAAKGIERGDKVTIEVDSSVMLKVYFLLYGLPVTIFVISLCVIQKLAGVPILSFFGGLFLTGISLALIFWLKYSRTGKEASYYRIHKG